MGWDGPLTDRQFLVWQAWLDEDYNHPSRGDLYLMQVAHEARYSAASRKPAFRAKPYLIEVKAAQPDPIPRHLWRPGMPRPVTKDDIARINREAAVRRVKGGGKAPNRPRS